VILATGLGKLRAVGGIERLHRVEGVVAVFGVADLCEELTQLGHEIPRTTGRAGAALR
jgi:hypothetical protein